MSDDIIPIKRGPGRPKGSKNKAAKFNHYKPKRWEPWMTSLVLAHLSGKFTNQQIADDYNITATHVSNILSTQEAEAIELSVRKNLQESSKSVADRLLAIQDKAVKHIEGFINRDDLAVNAPFNYIREVKDILKMTFPTEAESKGNVTNNIQNNVLVANPEFVQRIAEGLETSNRVAVIHNETKQKIEEQAQKLLKASNG